MSRRTAVRPATPPQPRAAPRLRLAVGALALSAVAALTGCAQAVSLQPGVDATDPGCAEISVFLPEALGDQQQRETDAQATSAWGTPASVLLRCGIEEQGPTTLPCIDVDGVDWVMDESDAPRYRFTTYGRTPTTEVIVDNDLITGVTALTDLSDAIERIPQTNTCVDVQDVPGGAPTAPDEAESPAPDSTTPTGSPAP